MAYPLPYAYAREHELLLEDKDGVLSLWTTPTPDLNAWSEVSRMTASTGIEQFHVLSAAELRQKISSVYATGESSAATVAHRCKAMWTSPA